MSEVQVRALGAPENVSFKMIGCSGTLAVWFAGRGFPCYGRSHLFSRPNFVHLDFDSY